MILISYTKVGDFENFSVLYEYTTVFSDFPSQKAIKKNRRKNTKTNFFLFYCQQTTFLEDTKRNFLHVHNTASDNIIYFYDNRNILI